jgi:hypothetical protein
MKTVAITSFLNFTFSFPLKRSFDFLSFPDIYTLTRFRRIYYVPLNVLTLSHFRRIYYVSLYCDFLLQSRHKYIPQIIPTYIYTSFSLCFFFCIILFAGEKTIASELTMRNRRLCCVYVSMVTLFRKTWWSEFVSAAQLFLKSTRTREKWLKAASSPEWAKTR